MSVEYPIAIRPMITMGRPTQRRVASSTSTMPSVATT